MNRKLYYVLISPARNEDKYIEKTIQSVISQTVLPKKWVIVSDASTDRTDELVKHYMPDNPWIELIRMPEHRDRQFAAKVQAPEAEFHIYGRGPEKNNLENLIEELGLGKRVFIKEMVPIEQIAHIMANADLGIIPKRNDPFGGEAFSTKILEFMSLGIPVIVSETKIDRFYFNDSVLKFFRPEDADDLAQCMLLLIGDKALRDRLRENALRFIVNYSWDKRKQEYLDLVDSLTKN